MGKISALKKLFKLSDSKTGEGYSEKSDESGEQNSAGEYYRNLITLLQPYSFETEQFKMLRTKILFPASGDPPQSIMITSAVSEEGKSFVAANLAVSIAQTTDRYVMLMDCDMRKPTIHRLFGFDDAPGLSEYLSDNMPLGSLLLKTEIQGLTILPGGRTPHNPSELLSSEKMASLLKEVKTKYSDRYIVIDSPPPLIMAGTTVIARQVEGIIVVVKYGSTPQSLITELINTMQKEKVLGIVINASKYRGHGKKGRYGKLYSRYEKEK